MTPEAEEPPPDSPLSTAVFSSPLRQPLVIGFILSFALILILSQFSPHFPSFEFHRSRQTNGCDYSFGRWIPDDDIPTRTYTENCPFLDPGFHCRQNGRKDDSYLRWRWQSDGCDLPRFNATNLLERAKNGRIVFVGDSIGRNHWESLVCLLASSIKNRSSVYEENGNPITKHKGFLSIRFSDYNLTVEYYRNPFLVTVGHPPPNTSTTVRKVVIVDQLPWQSAQWARADILVFNAGHWWSREKTQKMGCYFQEGERLNTNMEVREAFRKSLQTWKRWVLEYVDFRRSYVFFRSFSPVHFSDGTWDKGGHCEQNTEPDSGARSIDQPEPWTNEDILEVIEQIGGANGRARFLNITYLTQLRKDGHPSLHREPGTGVPYPQDCSHWCLPGVPDTWNELLYAQLLHVAK